MRVTPPFLPARTSRPGRVAAMLPSGMRCFWHPYADEPPDETAFRVCGECFHSWASPQEFATSVYTLEKEVSAAFSKRIRLNPNTIAYCPLCAHDW